MPEESPPTDEQLAAQLRAGGAEVRVTRKGRLHTVDFRRWPHEVTPPTLQPLTAALRIKELYLAGAAGDDCAVVLAEFGSLETLDLENTAVTDAALPSLERLQQLKLLVLRGTRVSREAVAALRKRMIGTRIVY